MDFAGHSDPFIRYAFWAGAMTFSLAGFTTLFIVVLRVSFAWKTRRTQRMLQTWRLLFAQALSGEQPTLPPVHRKELVDFLYLWLHHHESLRGEAKFILNDMLSTLGLIKPLRHMLARGNLKEKLLVVTALGHIGCGEAWDELVALAQGTSPTLSIMSARALMMIDPAAAADVVIPLIIRRRDWSPAKLALMLKEAKPVFANRFLQEVAQAAQQNAPYLVRLLRLVEALGLNRRLPFLSQLLRESSDAEVVSACLRMLHDPNEIELVRAHLQDADWRVRVQVANAMCRLGDQNDLPGLLKLLTAPEWWVRYRAAQAIAKMPFLQQEDIAQMQASLTDRYARDMLQQVMAEGSFA